VIAVYYLNFRKPDYLQIWYGQAIDMQICVKALSGPISDPKKNFT
jgi:hypothetical protein